MNLGLYFFNYLLEKGSAELPGFGVFTLKKKSASIDKETSKLLPPTQEISFMENKNVFNSDFSKHIVEMTGENLFIVQSNIKEEVKKWLSELNENQKVYIDELGEFIVEEGKIVLTNKKDFTKNPQYFGLEEINVQEIIANKKDKSPTTKGKENKSIFSKTILWTFFFIIPLGGLIYLGVKYQDQLFGGKSFKDISVKNSTHRIEEKPIVKDSSKVDSVKNSKKDTITISK